MKEISDILIREIRDPRISGVVSITDVEVSHDNSHAKVFFSVFGDKEKKAEVAAALEAQTSHIRYEVGKRIRLRVTPTLNFIEDSSLERGDRIQKLIDKISRGEV